MSNCVKKRWLQSCRSIRVETIERDGQPKSSLELRDIGEAVETDTDDRLWSGKHFIIKEQNNHQIIQYDLDCYYVIRRYGSYLP